MNREYCVRALAELLNIMKTIWENVIEWLEEPFGTIWLIERKQKSQTMSSQLHPDLGARILSII